MLPGGLAMLTLFQLFKKLLYRWKQNAYFPAWTAQALKLHHQIDDNSHHISDRTQVNDKILAKNLVFSHFTVAKSSEGLDVSCKTLDNNFKFLKLR